MNSRIDDGLYLHWATGGNVRDGPTGFFPDTVLGRRQQGQQSWKGTGGNDDLGLQVISGNDVTNRSKSGSLDRGRVVPVCEERL